MLQPLGKRVAVKVAAKEEKTAGGLVLPSAAKEQQQYGEIVAVSRELQESGEVKIGDQVVFEQYAGAQVKHNGEELLVIAIDHVIAVLG
ncbi:co-chaperone GroES [Aerococcaceae bacterium NML191292]|nr:co-chaperone GroES [Aerococcaceae bacterium NML210727]MCW6654813.1 co-chaperone GroES [Aerococcaceae bacterium NML201296]MCW6659263.1 co-chaperone GroES [Aerococcaceae bacterium NML191292]MCW6661318.1 co-chaperone GroES [Aerococcaceae bacterium NML201209]MCW6666077.1 co-chaperone GroES [Aerococcaceae bacterium NML190938]MCW6676222.1 co-chaperone GroES [Aerococcaceae bacterium NML180378]MCW6680228.1 co-chaperone GroES [Aerococcaceae bacterium NML130460]MCW6681942.1 co-chaperone GroES [Aero